MTKTFSVSGFVELADNGTISIAIQATPQQAVTSPPAQPPPADQPTPVEPQPPPTSPPEPPPESPPPVPPTSPPTPEPPQGPRHEGHTYRFRAGESAARLQTLLDALRPGDTLLIDNDAAVSGQWVLREQPRGQAPITVRAASIPTIRPTLTDALPSLSNAYIGQGSILFTDPRAHSYRLIGLRFDSKAGYAYNQLLLGDPVSSVLDDQPEHLRIERCVFVGHPTDGTRRAIFLNSGSTVIQDCYVTEIKDFVDSQAIAGVNGPGPYNIVGNVLEAAGENIMFGGSAASISGLNPKGIFIANNIIRKLDSWRGRGWVVKNLLELKRAENVIIESNMLENCWMGAHRGEAFVFTVRGEGYTIPPPNPWAAVRNVIVRKNRIMAVGGAATLLGRDDLTGYSGTTENILFEHNLFVIDPARGNRTGFLVLTGAKNITLIRNTLVFAPTAQYIKCISLDSPPTDTSPASPGWQPDYPIENLIVERNILMGELFGRALPSGQRPLDVFCRGYSVQDNIALWFGIPNARRAELNDVLDAEYRVKEAYSGYGAEHG